MSRCGKCGGLSDQVWDLDRQAYVPKCLNCGSGEIMAKEPEVKTCRKNSCDDKRIPGSKHCAIHAAAPAAGKKAKATRNGKPARRRGSAPERVAAEVFNQLEPSGVLPIIKQIDVVIDRLTSDLLRLEHAKELLTGPPQQ